MGPSQTTVLWLSILGLAWLVPVRVSAEEPIDYLRDVKPLLREKCFACHGALKQEGGLRLDTAASIRRGGDSGEAVVPANPAASLLIERVTESDEALRMPLEATPLTEAQIDLLKAWIAAGSPGPADEQPEADPRDHWAFGRPQRPPIPAPAKGRWARNPIDAFVASEHERHGLTPRPAAERDVLLRRVFLDLVSLPPSRDQLRAFREDGSPDAYERLVDRLLDSPQYGERWGRHWMDVWRYSDWYGRRLVPDVWNSAPQIWRWRDWIVRSLNDDKGYDRMVFEMLAADEVAPDDAEAAVATGYLIRNWYALNPNDWMRANVEHTAKAFLGLTFNCAHCHDHKYDPISQEDYFRLRAFFEPIGIRQDRAPGGADPGPFQEYQYSVLRKVQRLGMVQVFDKTPDAPTWFYNGGDERNRVTEQGPIRPGVPSALGGRPIEITPVELPPEAYYPGLRPEIRETILAEHQTAVTKAETALASARHAADEAQPAVRERLAAAEADLAARRAEHESVAARIAADRVKYGEVADGDADEAARQASRKEREAAHKAAEAAVLSKQHQLALAEAKPPDDEKRAAEIDAATKQLTEARAALEQAAAALDDESQATNYTPLSGVYPSQSTGRRRALAEWIASRENPLTARVAVNHVWMRHFHAPLVSSVFDFGRSGAAPTHPELMDWLAVEFMESGWSLKHLHRLIVTSETYRMASSGAAGGKAERSPQPEGPPADNAAIDPENRFLWRMNTGRMEAEVVRDSLLHISGRLDYTAGGQELENSEALTTNRRSLYYSTHPESDGRSQFGALFDAPDANDCYRRTRSLVPQQALALTNSDLVHECSVPLAASLWRAMTSEEQSRPEAFVSAAFEQILGRAPRAAELEACTQFLARPQETAGGTDEAAAQARASLVRALFNHTDFVTIR